MASTSGRMRAISESRTRRDSLLPPHCSGFSSTPAYVSFLPIRYIMASGISFPKNRYSRVKKLAI
jgi:hypothetical protein